MAEPRGADGHQLPRGAGQAARGQPHASSTATWAARGGGKVSFTHLIGFAVVRAIAETIAGHELRLRRGRRRQAPRRPPRARRPRASPSTSRSPTAPARCSCRASSDADTLDFRGFWAAYEDLIRKVRTNKLSARRLRRRHRQPHQPGHDRHACSRCPGSCPARALIVGVGVARLPDRVPGRRSRRRSPTSACRRSSRSRSTYDHRIIQGAESGLFLKRVHELLLGDDGFYDEIFRSLGVPYEAVAVAPRRQPGRPRAGDAREADAGADRSINAHRVRGHLIADLDPLAAEGAPHAPRARPRHLRAHHLGPRPRVPHRRHRPAASRMPLGDILHVLRDAYCRTIGIEYMHIQEPGREALDPGAGRGRRRSSSTADEQRHILERLNAAEALEKFLATKYLGQKRFGIDGAESAIPILDARARARPPTPHMDSRRHGHGPPRPAQRAGQHRRQELRAALQGVRGQRRPRVDPGLGRREVPPRPDRQVRQPRAATTIPVELAANPSHLEAVDPVVVGMARAKQDLIEPPGRLPGAADPDPRRRRLRRPGRGGRDAQPVATSRATGSAARST